jgi:hypothetical protein
VNTYAPIPASSPPRRRPRTTPLDPSPPASTVPGMSAEEQLRKQDWKRIRKQLAAIAFHRTGKRSWAHAEDLAQQAITEAYGRADGWDPAKQELIVHLALRVRGLATNSWRRHRTTFEIAMSVAKRRHGVRHEGEKGKEIDAPSEDEPIDLALDRRRMADLFNRRLAERLAGDEIALTIVALLKEGTSEPEEQAEAAGLTRAQVRDGRRRLFRHAENVKRELSRELDAEDTEEQEVSP